MNHVGITAKGSVHFRVLLHGRRGNGMGKCQRNSEKDITTDSTEIVLSGKSLAEQREILHEFCTKFEQNITILPPEFSLLIDEHFWELV